MDSTQTAPTVAAATPPGVRKLHPLMFVPGTAFWGLVITGAVTDNHAFFTAATVLAGVTAVVVIRHKLKQSSAEKAERLRIWRTGRAATARVVNIGTRGGGINDHPMIDFELDVSIDGAPAYRVETRALVSELAIPRIQPGCEIAVRVDGRNPKNLVIDEKLSPYGYG